MDNHLSFRKKSNNIVKIKEAYIICGTSYIKAIWIKNNVLKSVNILIKINNETKIIKCCKEINQLSREIKHLFGIWGNCDTSALSGRFAESYAACTYNINAIIKRKKQRAFPTWHFDGGHPGDLIMTTEKGLKKLRDIANTAFGKFGKDLSKFKNDSSMFKYYKNILRNVPNRAMVQIKMGKAAATKAMKKIYDGMMIAGSHCTKNFFTFRGIRSFKIFKAPLKILAGVLKYNPVRLTCISIKMLNDMKVIKYIKPVSNLIKTSRLITGTGKFVKGVGKTINKVAIPFAICMAVVDLDNHVNKYNNGEETLWQASYRTVLDIIAYNEIKYIITHPIETVKDIWHVVTNPTETYNLIKKTLIDLNDKYTRDFEYRNLIEKRILQDHKFIRRHNNPRTHFTEFTHHIQKYYNEYDNAYQNELIINIKTKLLDTFAHLHLDEYKKTCLKVDKLDKIHLTNQDANIVFNEFEYDAHLQLETKYNQQLQNIKDIKDKDYLSYLELLEKLPKSTLKDLDEKSQSKYMRYGITLRCMISSSIINQSMAVGERLVNGGKFITGEDVLMISLGTVQSLASNAIMKSEFVNFNPPEIETTWLATKSTSSTKELFGDINVNEIVMNKKAVEIKAKIDSAKTKTELAGASVAGVLCSAISLIARGYQKYSLQNDENVKKYIEQLEEKIKELKKNGHKFEDVEKQLTKIKNQIEWTMNDLKSIAYDGCKGGTAAYVGSKLAQKGAEYLGKEISKRCIVGSAAIVGGGIALAEGIYDINTTENSKLADHNPNKVTKKYVAAKVAKSAVSGAAATGLTLLAFSNPVGWAALGAFTFGTFASMAIGSALSLGDNYCSKYYGQKREHYLYCCKQLNIEIDQQINEYFMENKFKRIMANSHPNKTDDIKNNDFTKRVNELLPHVIFILQYYEIKINNIDNFQDLLQDKVIELVNKRISIISQFEIIDRLLNLPCYITNISIQPMSYECLDDEYELPIICGLKNVNWNNKVIYEFGSEHKQEIKLSLNGKIEYIQNISKIKALHLTSNNPENNNFGKNKPSVISKNLAENVWLIFLSQETAECYIESEKKRIYC